MQVGSRHDPSHTPTVWFHGLAEVRQAFQPDSQPGSHCWPALQVGSRHDPSHTTAVWFHGLAEVRQAFQPDSQPGSHCWLAMQVGSRHDPSHAPTVWFHGLAEGGILRRLFLQLAAQRGSEELPSQRIGAVGNLFRSALNHHLSTRFGRVGTHVDDVVGGLHHLQVMLDHD